MRAQLRTGGEQSIEYPRPLARVQRVQDPRTRLVGVSRAGYEAGIDLDVALSPDDLIDEARAAP